MRRSVKPRHSAHFFRLISSSEREKADFDKNVPLSQAILQREFGHTNSWDIGRYRVQTLAYPEFDARTVITCNDDIIELYSQKILKYSKVDV